MGKGVKRGLLNAVQRRGSIESTTNTLSAACNLVGVSGFTGRDNVLTAIESLEREGSIAVVREGRQIKKISYVSKQRAYVDRTERSPQQKREGTFAKGVPAYLTDDMVTPVIITHKQKEAKMADATIQAEIPVTLNKADERELALTALQVTAIDHEGGLSSTEAHHAVMEALNCPRPLAHKLILELVTAGFASMSGHGRSVSYVINDQATPISEQPALPASEEIVMELTIEQRLLAVIQELEQANAELTSQVSTMAAERIAHGTTLASLRKENAQLRQENEQLRRPDAMLDPAIEAVLRRHGK